MRPVAPRRSRRPARRRDRRFRRSPTELMARSALSDRAKSAAWRATFSRWRPETAQKVPGYSLALPVPADLPVFLRLALATAAAQADEHRVETLVIPDAP